MWSLRWVVDPGPAIPSHVAALRDAADGGIEGVVLTHSHADHAEAADEFGVPVVLPADCPGWDPFTVIATPGHSPDSVCLLFGRVCFTGDTVLGEGSVFIAPGEGSLSAYLDSLRRLRSLDLEALCPGHGPVVWDPAAKLDEYIAHRLDRERRLARGAGGGPSHRLRALGRGVAGGTGVAAARGGADVGGAHGEAWLRGVAASRTTALRGRVPDGVCINRECAVNADMIPRIGR